MEGGRGRWIRSGAVKPVFDFEFEGYRLECRLTEYGHVGVFFEQRDNWEWLMRRAVRGKRYLNLFAYTGVATLALARAGGRVTHIDASRSAVNWAKRNAALSGVRADFVRWIVEDARVFVRREAKRGNRYAGIVLDPPTFGRGPKNEVWKIDRDLMNLLDECRALCENGAQDLVLLSAHAHGFTRHVLANALAEIFPGRRPIESGEMVLRDEADRELPSGAFARFGN